MGIKNQSRVHKDLAWYQQRLTDIELGMRIMGILLIGVGGMGILITLCVDFIRYGEFMPSAFKFSWLQALGTIIFGVIGWLGYRIIELTGDK